MSKQSELEQALSYDAIAHAEQITGATSANDGVAFLGMALMLDHNKTKARLLQEINDTNAYRQTLTEWIAVIESMGFALVLDDPIDGTVDRLRIWWNGAVLLVSDSYLGRSANSAKAYFNFRGPREAMFHCSNGWAGEDDGVDVWHGSKDAREGFRFTLDKMREAGTLLPKWKARPFLWLLSYQDSKEPGYDYSSINAERIARLPADVQLAIAGDRS